MKIIDLKEEYPLVYEAALKNQELQGNKRNDYLDIFEDKNGGNFNFNSSLEKELFWFHIGKSQFEKAFKICPHLKTPEKLIPWIPKVGDGVVCKSSEEALELLTLARDKGYPVNHASLSTVWSSFYYNNRDLCGCASSHITNLISKEKFIELVTGKSGGNPQPWIPKVGDKVKIPKTKSGGYKQSVEACISVNEAKKANQEFLVIRSINNDTADLSNITPPQYCNTFALSDLEPYEELIDQSESLQSTLNSINNNKNEQQNKNSNIIKTDRLVSETKSGEKPGGNPIRGRTRTATIESRPVSYSASIIKC